MPEVSIDDFLAQGAKATDSGPAIQAAIDSLVDPDPRWPDKSGGKIRFGKGRYFVRTPIFIRVPGVIIEGCGGPHSHVCSIEWRNDDVKAALFTFESTVSKPAGFRMRDILLRSDKKTGVAIRFGEGSGYTRDFILESVGVKYFAKAIEVGQSDAKWGGLTLRNCTMIFNDQVVDAIAGRLNETHVDQGLYSKNGTENGPYAFDWLGGTNISFNQVVLEGQPRVLRLRRAQGLRVMGCRFEGNATSKDPVCLVEDSSFISIRDSFHRLLGTEQAPEAPPTILLRRCRDYYVTPMLGRVQIERIWEPRY